MLAAGEDFGHGADRPHPRVNLEFVSVNPNGPLRAGHGRYAAYGDALQRLLKFSGMNVATEFYINDYGRQMDRFGRSVAARYAQSFGVNLSLPRDGYHGEYVKTIATDIRAEVDDRYLEILTRAAATTSTEAPDGNTSKSAGPAPGETLYEDEDEEPSERSDEWPDDALTKEALLFFRQRACQAMLEEMRAELEAFGVLFDCWFSETRLHTEGRLEEVVRRLVETGEAYREGDAIWLRTTTRGDDKDRVLVRQNGVPTYFAADIAYHEDKLERGSASDQHLGSRSPRLCSPDEGGRRDPGRTDRRSGSHHRSVGEPAGRGRTEADVHQTRRDGDLGGTRRSHRR